MVVAVLVAMETVVEVAAGGVVVVVVAVPASYVLLRAVVEAVSCSGYWLYSFFLHVEN